VALRKCGRYQVDSGEGREGGEKEERNQKGGVVKQRQTEKQETKRTGRPKRKGSGGGV